jgi:hypothetical protein
MEGTRMVIGEGVIPLDDRTLGDSVTKRLTCWLRRARRLSFVGRSRSVRAWRVFSSAFRNPTSLHPLSPALRSRNRPDGLRFVTSPTIAATINFLSQVDAALYFSFLVSIASWNNLLPRWRFVLSGEQHGEKATFVSRCVTTATTLHNESTGGRGYNGIHTRNDSNKHD